MDKREAMKMIFAWKWNEYVVSLIELAEIYLIVLLWLILSFFSWQKFCTPTHEYTNGGKSEYIFIVLLYKSYFFYE